MSEPQDFIDADMFDAEVVDAFEKSKEQQEASADINVGSMLEARRQAYVRVFTPGASATQADINVVLADLAWFCRAYAPSYDVRDGEHAQVLAHMKDGRREVFNRIMDNTQLDRDAIFKMYAAALQPR